MIIGRRAAQTSYPRNIADRKIDSIPPGNPQPSTPAARQYATESTRPTRYGQAGRREPAMRLRIVSRPSLGYISLWLTIRLPLRSKL
jgi:hypothetical protein